MKALQVTRSNLSSGSNFLHSFLQKLHTTQKMAKSKFEYVKQFEADDTCLPNCWIVIRIDGKNFHRFSERHHFLKPNDERSLSLMTRAAQTVMDDFRDIALCYGQSDEYSFVFRKNTDTYSRRSSKLMTNVVSLFSSSFVFHWSRFFPTQSLDYPPSFDGRVVLYPTDQNLRDYLSWRQADCHINNLYNTCFWKLVQERDLSPAQAQLKLKGTLSSDKNEMLFSEFTTNYNNLPEIYKKGTVLFRQGPDEVVRQTVKPKRVQYERIDSSKKLSDIVAKHCDIIGASFWDEHPHVLSGKPK